MTEPQPPGKPKSFDDRLRAIRDRRKGPRGGAGAFGRLPASMVGMALRIGLELVAALGVGVAIGWGLDRWLGTRPWLMVVFFFVGAGAGILNVYRAVEGYGLAPGYRREGERAGPENGPDRNGRE